jgi:threonylcarbamoyladenosine tRNA methylthiotransferase MtaB
MALVKSISDTIDQVVKNAQLLAEKGVKEIVLTGVNLGDFGKGPNGDAPVGLNQRPENFFKLIQALDQIDGIERFRISSIEPNLLTNEIIDFVAESKRFMPHFHIPLQSGSNEVLRLMRRRYQRELYTERVSRIKEKMPHCAIGVDVIVGSNGETEDYFKETFDYLHSLDISYLHVFTYSERDNTKALEIDYVVPVAVRNERNKILRNLSYMKMQFFTQQFSGSSRKVLWESANRNGMIEGYTDNYIRVQAPFKEEWCNQIMTWGI